MIPKKNILCGLKVSFPLQSNYASYDMFKKTMLTKYVLLSS